MVVLRDLIARCASNFPTKTAYISGERTSTWRQMEERSGRLAAALLAMGVRKGDCVAILGGESIEVYEHFFACARIGAVRLGLNAQYAWPELLHVLRDSRPSVILIDARFRHVVEEHLGGIGARLVGYNPGHGCREDYETVLARHDPLTDLPAIDPDDLLLYSYTSGTTGAPKGAMLTQGAAVSVILHSLAAFGLERDDIWYMPAASAWAIVLMGLFGLGNGMTTVVPDGGFEIARYLEEVEARRVTATILVPTMIQRALAQLRQKPRDLSALRLLVYGSAPATPRLIRDAREELKVRMVQAYGQTESTGGWMAVLTDDDHRLGLEHRPELLRSAGRIGINYECTIRDESGRILPVGEKGEIWLRGDTLMKGYLNLPEETAEVLRDGWLRSNDIGRLDADGYLYLLDRQKFMIITGAVNVFPTAVEAVLGDHPAIAEVAVVGVPHPDWGEAVVAVAVGAPGQDMVDTPTIRRFCENRLSRAETPQHILFVPELPKTPNGKVRKAEIRQGLIEAEGSVPWSIPKG